MRSREPLVGHGGRGQRRRGSHAGGFSPTTRRRRRGAAEHCVNGLTREVHMPMAPTWVSRAVRRPSLADSARATAQQCRHGQVFLHTSAAGCALAPQERLEAGIPNVLRSTVAFLTDGILWWAKSGRMRCPSSQQPRHRAEACVRRTLPRRTRQHKAPEDHCVRASSRWGCTAVYSTP